MSAIAMMLSGAAAGGGGSPGTLPVSGALAWYAPDFGQFTDLGTTPVSADGDHIRQWNDQSGNSYNLVRTDSDVGSRPFYRPGVTDARGKKCVGFEGAQHLQIPDALGSALSSAGQGTIVMSFKNRVANGSDIGRAPYAFTASGQVSLLLWSDGNIYENFGCSARKAPFAPGVALNTSFNTYAVWSKTNDYGIYLNNTSKYTDSSNTVSFRTSSLNFGRNDESGAWWFNAYVAEIIIFARKLTTVEIGSFHTYLTT